MTLPVFVRAPLAALQFSSPDCEELSRLDRDEWKRTLSFCDRAQLTLPLALRCRDRIPEEVRSRVERNLAGNAERWSRVRTAYREAAGAFAREGISFAVLKGFSHCPAFVRDPRWRPQYDIDLLLPPDQLLRAREVAAALGYEPLDAPSHRVDHLPTMIRKTGWQWRGDLFDPDIPVSLELHFRLWDERTEHFPAPGVEAFWDRREWRELEGMRFPAFHTVDELAYASLHLLRHLLRGDVKPFHVYEIASLLHKTAGDECFWTKWAEWHDASLRPLEGICFALANRWFGCALSVAAREEIERLPPEVVRWFELYEFSPLTSPIHPNKDELWLHWSLIHSSRARWSMLRRRMIPAALPCPVDAVHVPDREITWRLAARRRWRYMVFSGSRAAHHLAAMPGVAMSAVQWFAGLPGQYWIFFLTAASFNFGLFIFFFLYNLYLLQLGFHEDFLGLVSGVMTAGSLAGCVPAAAAIRRFGLRRALFAAFLAVAGISALRATITNSTMLTMLAFAAGFAASAWAVAISPAVAQLTTERNRCLGFSMIFSSGVGIGIAGGFAGGYLPGRLAHAFSSNVTAYRASLLLGCAVVLMALVPLSRLRIDAPAASEPVFRRPSPLLRKFFTAFVVWNLGTGAFNPFFGAFFVHLRFSTERIGALFSWAQLAQALAMLAAPLAIQRIGMARGIPLMQLATAVSLAGLAVFSGAAPTSFAYGAYTVSQYMTEPAIFALLMSSVIPAQRARVSAMNMIVIFGAQAAAAAGSGALIARFGYPRVLAGAALICAAAALLFYRLRPGRSAPLDS